MPLKTTIDATVDVRDFAASLSALNKFSTVILKSDTEWARYNEHVLASNRLSAQITKQLVDHSRLVEKSHSVHSQFSVAIGRAGSVFSRMARDTLEIARNLTRSVASLFDYISITGLISGLIGLGGGLFGAEKLAQSVTQQRKTALGLGTPSGQVSAFELNYQRYADTQSVLGNVATGLYDKTSPQYRALLAAGVDENTLKYGNAADVSVALFGRLNKMFGHESPANIGVRAESYGLTSILGVQDIIRYVHSTDQETQLKHYINDTKTLTLSGKAQLAWSKFDTALERAGLRIVNILETKLVALANPLSKLSESTIKLINVFAKSKLPDKILSKVESGFKWIAKKLNNPNLNQSINDFMKGIDSFFPIVKIVTKGYNFIITSLKILDTLIREFDVNDPYYRRFSGALNDIFGPSAAPEPGYVPPQAHGRSIRYPSRPIPRDSGTGTHGVDQSPPFGPTWGETHSAEPAGGVSAAPARQTWAGAPSSPTPNIVPLPGETIEQMTARVREVNPQLTPGQCVELAFKYAGIPYTNAMVTAVTRGPAMTGGDLPAGTPVSTFFNADRTVGEHYAAGGTGTPGIGRDHMGIFAGVDSKGNPVLINQWSSQSPTFTPYGIGDRPGTEHDANAYFAIIDEMGLPAGTFEHNPYRRQILGAIAANRFSDSSMALNRMLGPQGPVDPGIIARRKGMGQQTSYLDQYQGLKSTRAVVVKNQAGSNAIVTQGGMAFA